MGIYEIHADNGFISLRFPAILRKLLSSAKRYSGLPSLIKKAANDGIKLAYKELN